MMNEEPPKTPKIRRRDRIILILIAVLAIGTFLFAILQFVTMKRGR